MLMQSAQYQLHASVEDSHWWFAGRRQIMQDLVRAGPAHAAARGRRRGLRHGSQCRGAGREYDCLGIDSSCRGDRAGPRAGSRAAIPLRARARRCCGVMRGRGWSCSWMSSSTSLTILRFSPDCSRHRRPGRLPVDGAGESLVLVGTRREQRPLSALRPQAAPAELGGTAGHDAASVALTTRGCIPWPMPSGPGAGGVAVPPAGRGPT